MLKQIIIKIYLLFLLGKAFGGIILEIIIYLEHLHRFLEKIISSFCTFTSDIWNTGKFLIIFSILLLIIAELDTIEDLPNDKIKPCFRKTVIIYRNYYSSFKEVITCIFIALPVVFPYYENSISNLDNVINLYSLLGFSVCVYVIGTFAVNTTNKFLMKESIPHLKRLYIIVCLMSIITSVLCFRTKGVLSNNSEKIICAAFLVLPSYVLVRRIFRKLKSKINTK